MHGLKVLTWSMETTYLVLKGNVAVPHTFSARETKSWFTACHGKIYLVLSMKSGEAEHVLPFSWKEGKGFPHFPFLVILDPANILL